MASANSGQDSTSNSNRNIFSSLEEEIAFHINKARFKNKEFTEKMLKKIKNKADPQSKTIFLESLNRTINYYDEEILQSFFTYVERNEQTCQILEDISFIQKLNDKFVEKFGEKLRNEGKIGFLSGEESLETVKKELGSKSNEFYGYYIERIALEDINTLLMMVILEEFIILNSKALNKSIEASNVSIESSMNVDNVCFLSNKFNTICIFLNSVQKNPPENNKLYNLYIILLETDYITKEDFQEGKKEVEISDEHIEKRKFQHLPKKYDKIYIPNMQIPKASINKLVIAMDSDNDYKVTLDDIINFARKHFIHFERTFFEKMFLEAASKRNQYRPINLKNMAPLSFEEIQYAMRMTLVKKDDKWVEHYRPFRDIWMLFLSNVDESKLSRKSLPDLNIREIPNMEDFINSKTNAFKTNSLKITEIQPSYQKSYIPEAHLIVNNTKYIKEIVYDRNNPDIPSPNPFEKVVNKEFHSIENNSSIGFDTRLYYEEALKLSHTPEKYLKVLQNPILTYVPEMVASEKYLEKYKTLGMAKSKQGLTPENSFFTNEKNNKDFLDLENMTEKMDNCGSSFQNLAMSIAFTETLPRNKKSSVVYNPISNLPDNTIKLPTPPKKKQPKIFHSAFKFEDCETLKKRLAKLDPLLDKYSQPTEHIFREDYVDAKKPFYKIRFKCAGMENPNNISSMYLKSTDQEVLEGRKKNEEIKKIQDLDRKKEKPLWRSYFKQANLIRKEGFIDLKPPKFLEKGEYIEPVEIHVNMYRDQAYYNELFKLYHKPLSVVDKFKVLGQN